MAKLLGRFDAGGGWNTYLLACSDQSKYLVTFNYKICVAFKLLLWAFTSSFFFLIENLIFTLIIICSTFYVDVEVK